jgi:hypothetical protein
MVQTGPDLGPVVLVGPQSGVHRDILTHLGWAKPRVHGGVTEL